MYKEEYCGRNDVSFVREKSLFHEHAGHGGKINFNHCIYYIFINDLHVNECTQQVGLYTCGHMLFMKTTQLRHRICEPFLHQNLRDQYTLYDQNSISPAEVY